MKQAAIALLAGLLCGGSPIVRADSGNPFGFETDTHPLTYEYCKKWKGKDSYSHFWYQCRSAPRMHPDIENIFLKFVDDVGLCAIDAPSFDINKKKTISLDGFKEQIAETYGPPTSKTGNEHATHQYDWDREAGFPSLGDIEAIRVKKSDRGGAYRVTVIFWLVTFDECEKAIDQKRAEAF